MNVYFFENIIHFVSIIHAIDLIDWRDWNHDHSTIFLCYFFVNFDFFNYVNHINFLNFFDCFSIDYLCLWFWTCDCMFNRNYKNNKNYWWFNRIEIWKKKLLIWTFRDLMTLFEMIWMNWKFVIFWNSVLFL